MCVCCADDDSPKEKEREGRMNFIKYKDSLKNQWTVPIFLHSWPFFSLSVWILIVLKCGVKWMKILWYDRKRHRERDEHLEELWRGGRSDQRRAAPLSFSLALPSMVELKETKTDVIRPLDSQISIILDCSSQTQPFESPKSRPL